VKEILVLNLGRFGDLIQTTPLLRGLKRKHPHARVTLVVQKRFRAILPLMSGVDRHLLFDHDGLAHAIASKDSLHGGYLQFDEFLSLLERENYDLIVNLTSTELSAHLVTLLRSKQVAGKTSAPDGRMLIKNPWALYLYSFLLGDSRRYNRINLADIFCKMAGVEPDGHPVELHETEAGHHFADDFMKQMGLNNQPLVGIQLGASDAVRCWSVESFARLSDLLQETAGFRTILLGSPTERPVAEHALSLMKYEAVNAVGRTTIEELYSLVRRCALLVSNDTGTMHFAAAGGTPTVMLTIGPASFFCTGPLSAGNLALQAPLPCSPCRYNLSCHHPVCRDHITVESVGNACRYLLGDTSDLDQELNRIRIFQSEFGPDRYLEWQPLCNGDPEHENLTQRYSRLWKEFLDEKRSHSDFRRSLYPELERLTAQGSRLTAAIMAAACETPLPLTTINNLGAEEALVESSLRCLAGTIPAASPLVDFMTIWKDNITESDLISVATTTHQIYGQGNQLAANL
jgi:ADP-heptose:LPS heptosyltransferase